MLIALEIILASSRNKTIPTTVGLKTKEDFMSYDDQSACTEFSYLFIFRYFKPTCASDDDAFSFYSMSIKLTASIFFYLKSNSENHKDFILLGFC